jgi:hypothetical protein
VAVLKGISTDHLSPTDKAALDLTIQQQETHSEAVKQAGQLRNEKREAYAFHDTRVHETFKKLKESERWARGATPRRLRKYDDACDDRRAAKNEMEAQEKAFYHLQGVQFTEGKQPKPPKPSGFGKVIHWIRNNVSGSGEINVGKVPLYQTKSSKSSSRDIPPTPAPIASPTKSPLDNLAHRPIEFAEQLQQEPSKDVLKNYKP